MCHLNLHQRVPLSYHSVKRIALNVCGGHHNGMLVEGWKPKSAKGYWLKKQIEPFCMHLSGYFISLFDRESMTYVQQNWSLLITTKHI